MSDPVVSIIVPARNEQFMPATVDDLCAKARGSIEVIVVLDGYWPECISGDNRVHYIHHSAPRGLRRSLNEGVAIARGQYVMKLDAHCMVSEGFDTVLANVCQDDWVCVPTRHRLDAENWRVDDGGRPPINYLYLEPSNDGINVKEWREKNRDRSLDAIRVDDILACQGSCMFLPRDFWYELELLDEEHYGKFRKDPQEVMFKAWSIGGRCVRVKDAWYAHLHKGKRYGRGYRPDRASWAQGDEYVKKWWTDEAWDKQRISFRDILRRFPDMPGWADHPWMADLVETYDDLPNLYQYLELPDGRPFSRPRPDRATSKFWNEGRWHTFIEPLLPDSVEGQTFIEMGADAGLMCKLAEDHGYARVIGIEKNKTPVREGTRYRDAIGYHYELRKEQLGTKYHEAGTFDVDRLPVADVTLMSTFHYYIDLNNWLRYVNALRLKTCYVLIVSRPHMDVGHWLAQADLDAVYGYFDGWREVGRIEDVPTEGDSKPRELYSVLLSNPLLRRVPLADIDTREGERDPMYRAMVDLAGRIADGEDFDLYATDYAQRWAERKAGKWSERTLRHWLTLKAGVMRGVAEEGLKEPILVERGTLRLCDGGHRLAVLRALGRESVIAREV